MGMAAIRSLTGSLYNIKKGDGVRQGLGRASGGEASQHLPSLLEFSQAPFVISQTLFVISGTGP